MSQLQSVQRSCTFPYLYNKGLDQAFNWTGNVYDDTVGIRYQDLYASDPADRALRRVMQSPCLNPDLTRYEGNWLWIIVLVLLVILVWKFMPRS